MRKIFIFSLITSFCLNALSLDLKNLAKDASGHSRLEFVASEQLSEKNAIVLGIPGFNVKPSSFRFALERFADVGIPGLLLSFSGCKQGETKDDMSFENWKKDTHEAIDFALELSKKYDLKLIILGHSMGGLYAQYTLGQMEKDNLLTLEMKERVKLVLFAPADGLKSLKSVIAKANINPLLLSFLPENNYELLEMAQMLDTVLNNFPLGKLICGENAAQDFLSVSSFAGLVLPSKSLIYPSVASMVFFYNNDQLIRANFYEMYDSIFPSCQIVSLGEHENMTFAHTFEHFKYDNHALTNEIIAPVLSMLETIKLAGSELDLD